jgi:acyl dehydratase
VEAEHVWLAWLTHNVSDVHGNADAASRGAWGQPLVLGMLTAAIVVGLAEPALGPPAGAARNLGQGWDAITLERPVVAGSTLTAESRFEHVEASQGAADVLVRRTIIGRDETGAVVVTIRETRHLAAEG